MNKTSEFREATDYERIKADPAEGLTASQVKMRFTEGLDIVVELMSENCSVKRTRRDCEAKGIPYRRFYYDHQGWWNTRKYVVTRIRQALGEL